MSVTHGAVVVIPDDPAFPVGSDEWNAAHTGTIDDTMHGSRGAALHSDAHNKSHAHDGADGSGTVAHTNTTGKTADDHHAQIHASAHQPGGGDAMAVDASAATGSLRTLGTGSAQSAAGNHTSPAATATVAGHVPTPPNDPTTFLRGDATWAAPSDPLLIGQLDPGTVSIPTETFVLHRDHLKLSSTERLTHVGTSRVYLRDIGENSYGPQAELAPPGFIIAGTPKAPSVSFMVPTDYQYQLLDRLTLRGAMRGALVGTADLYLENDAPSGGRIAISGRGVNASG